MRMIVAIGTLALAGCVSGEPAAETVAMPTAGGDCAAIAQLALPGATITRAELAGAGSTAPAGGLNVANLPGFCRVAATLKPTSDSDIRIEVWMPAATWNGKFLGTGNGGAAGSIGYPALADGVTRGYAVAATDTGHQGGAADYSFAVGHPEKLADNAWRAVHEMTVAGKAIAKAYYSAGPRLSYWNACSTGGRQGLKEAQRFPEDYDGIVAGAPARAWPGLPGVSLLIQLVMNDPAGLPPTKLSVLKEAAIRQCDAVDGVTDRIVNDHRKCAFDPAVAQCAAGDAADCLTAGQVAAARRLYDGLRHPADGSRVFPGTFPGSEPAWAGLGRGFTIGESYFRNVVRGGDPAWTPSLSRLGEDVALALRQQDGAMDATSPDIAAFMKRGGKLILWHGLTDGLIPAQSTIDHHASLAARDPQGTAANVRLFLLPGVDHCRGGEGPSNVDWLAALEDWVERGRAPAKLTASGTIRGGGTRTRPVCAAPMIPRYAGSGSTDDVANYVCGAP